MALSRTKVLCFSSRECTERFCSMLRHVVEIFKYYDKRDARWHVIEDLHVLDTRLTKPTILINSIHLPVSWNKTPMGKWVSPDLIDIDNRHMNSVAAMFVAKNLISGNSLSNTRIIGEGLGAISPLIVGLLFSPTLAPFVFYTGAFFGVMFLRHCHVKRQLEYFRCMSQVRRDYGEDYIDYLKLMRKYKRFTWPIRDIFKPRIGVLEEELSKIKT